MAALHGGGRIFGARLDFVVYHHRRLSPSTSITIYRHRRLSPSTSIAIDVYRHRGAGMSALLSFLN